jgi:hypothetical protein
MLQPKASALPRDPNQNSTRSLLLPVTLARDLRLKIRSTGHASLPITITSPKDRPATPSPEPPKPSPDHGKSTKTLLVFRKTDTIVKEQTSKGPGSPRLGKPNLCLKPPPERGGSTYIAAQHRPVNPSKPPQSGSPRRLSGRRRCGAAYMGGSRTRQTPFWMV